MGLELPPVAAPGSLLPVGPLAPAAQARLEEITGRRLHGRNRVRILSDGVQSYTAMLDLVQAARHRVLFENFIFRDDAVGGAFAAVLRRRAEDGVDVRVLHDPFGSLMSLRAPIGFRFRRSAAQVRVYNPPRPTPAFFRDGRDHRKLIVQDRDRLVAGGMCLADVWSGNCVRHCTWRDTAVLVEGDVAGEAGVEFGRMWTKAVSLTPQKRGRAGRPQVDPSSPPPSRVEPALCTGEVPVRIVAGEPGARRLERALLVVFEAARREILITNPYLVPPARLLDRLTAAARRGVRVELMVPRHNNHRWAGLASEHLMGTLLEAGVRVWRWQGPMIHAKTVVVDRCWSLVGSSNLDGLSLRQNAEFDLAIHGTAVGEQLAAVFARDCTGSTPFRQESWRARGANRRWLSRAAATTRRWL
jgi:phosphatidylserine/phosphatidylglycerophosphate/cardiolipin synthase-like enzyme